MSSKLSSADMNTSIAVEKAKTEALFASIGEAVIATDEYGKIMRINDTALKLLGYAEEDLLGKNYLSSMPAYDLDDNLIDKFSRPITRCLIEGKSITRNMAYLRKNGEHLPVVVTVSPIMFEGRPIGAIEVFRDITQELKIDKAKTEFVSLASHQLRTPLTAIRWHLELLLRGVTGDLKQDQQEVIHEVHGINMRLIELVGALLSVARIEVGNLKVAPVLSDIEELAHNAVSELKPQISKKRLNFSEQYDPALPQLLLDRDLTHIIFQNLLTNAVKYTPEGGKIDLKVVCEGRDSILIKVADTGYGIPKQQQSQIFTKLYRADNVHEKDASGTGLGLYIVRSIVESFKGKVWCESEENKGATFYARLPLRGMSPNPRRAGLKR